MPVDYFTFFGLPRKLNVDLNGLEKEFYALSRRLHPDGFFSASEVERLWSLEQSSQLNDAYRTLKDPIRRTEYLLRLEGVELEEQSKQATEAARASGNLKKQVVPPALLEEVFELNMQLEELRANRKMGEKDDALEAELSGQKKLLEEKFDALFSELKGLWSEWDQAVESETEPARLPIRDKLLDLVNRRNYIRNLVRDVNEALEIG